MSSHERVPLCSVDCKEHVCDDALVYLANVSYSTLREYVEIGQPWVVFLGFSKLMQTQDVPRYAQVREFAAVLKGLSVTWDDIDTARAKQGTDA